MANHTSGPWKLILHGNESYPFPLTVHSENDEFWIARDGTVSSLAAARLIAAAPDLLEALELLTAERERQLQNRIKGSKNAHGEMPHEVDREAVRIMTAQVDQARAAISKAKGEGQ